MNTPSMFAYCQPLQYIANFPNGTPQKSECCITLTGFLQISNKDNVFMNPDLYKVIGQRKTYNVSELMNLDFKFDALS